MSTSFETQAVVATDGATDSPYVADDAGIAMVRPDGTTTRLINTQIRIVALITYTDGITSRQEYELEATRAGNTQRFRLSPQEFTRMTWIMPKLGPGAILAVGANASSHLRAAIQHLSDTIPPRHVYTHIGWTRVGDTWLYLSARGAIGAGGISPDVEVVPPDAVDAFTLADPPDAATLAAGLQASLSTLATASDPITIPLLAATYRAAIGGVNFALHLHGKTGSGKSQLAALSQQHFGATMDADHLPGSWMSTANANELVLFDAKDAICVVDDFNPIGGSADVAGMHRDADRLFRAQGNRQGRRRLDQDLNPVADKPPRGLMLSTGEDIPKGHSLRARAVLLEVSKGTVDWKALTRCQSDAAQGRYAAAMTGFIGWLAPRYDAIQARIRASTDARRQTSAGPIGHGRTAENVHQLRLGYDLLLEFAAEVGAISSKERADLAQRGEAVWPILGGSQRVHLEDSDQALRFLELLDQAISSGRAHVAGMNGMPPAGDHQPSAWGWRQVTTGSGRRRETTWAPQGERVGWVDGDILYLKADLAVAAAQQVGTAVGDRLTLTRQTLVKRLAEHGLLVATDSTRETYAIRKTVEGRSQSVIAIAVASLASRATPDEEGQLDEPPSSLLQRVRRR